MIFNSIDFAWFLPLVFLIYWFGFGRNRTAQNLFLIAAGYVFYGWWDWRFLGLLIASSLVDYSVGIGLGAMRVPRHRKALLWVSVAANLGLLGFFKYFGFFAENFSSAFTFFGGHIDVRTLHIVLPLGISFYTFQSLGYIIDVYRGTFKPVRDPIAYFAFVSFFPQLVAGPIERAAHMLPQFLADRRFEAHRATDGLRQILWGLFKKIVVADNCAPLVGRIFDAPLNSSGSTLALGAVLFAFQIYCDFSGYSDIAIGTGRLFGFDLSRNFAFPYFSRDIGEFWRRWHISLSTWFRDYVYIPLGGGRGGAGKKIRNIFIVFAVSGLWHGANWTFIVWGLVNALYFLPLLLLNRNRQNLDTVASGRWLPSLRDAAAITLTFALTCLAWIFFRARSVGQALDYIAGIFSPSLFSRPEIRPLDLLLLIGALLAMEWSARESQHALAGWVTRLWRPARWGIYAALLWLIWYKGNFSDQIEFIYFQF